MLSNLVRPSPPIAVAVPLSVRLNLVAGIRGQFLITTVVITLGLFGAVALSPPATAVTSPVSATGAATSTPGWETALGEAGTVGVDSPTDAWIVQYCNGIRTSCRSNAVNSTLMHWDGTSWSNATGLLSLDLDSVIAESPSDAWAAGDNEFAPGGTTAVVLHWDGAHWTNASITGNVVNTYLWSLSADSPTDAWAVGYRERGDGTSATYILHWSGSTWSVVPSPSPGSDSYQLLSVSAVSATDVWAVGYTTDATGAASALILHWNGTNWLQFASPTSTSDYVVLNAVSASPSGAWAVGTTGNPNFAPLFLHLSGGQWSVVNGPDPPGSIIRITGVSTINPSDAWMVGAYCPTGFCGGSTCTGSGCFTEKGLVEHWNGQVWTEVTVPDPSPSINELYGIAADGASDIWAVGLDEGVQQDKALTLHWNGQRWSNVWPG
jgi:hypothetical protein